MYRTVCLLALAAFAAGQYQQDARNAAILTDSRYQQGDGKFGASYTQEDGVEFKEESDPDGTRRGSYSYVDPSGQRKTVSYVAGKNGFQATGDHLPVGPAAVPSYTPDPKYNPPEYSAPRYESQQNSYNPPAQRYNPPQSSYSPPQNSYSPPQNSYSPPQNSYSPPQNSYSPPQNSYSPPQNSYNPPQQSYTQAPSYNRPQANYYSTTPAPHRFFPPGKLSLNRSPDGYSYTFNKA